VSIVAGVDFDLLAQHGAISGRHWATLASGRRLYLLSLHLKDAKAYDPVAIAEAVYPEKSRDHAVMCLWAALPRGLALDGDYAAIFVRAFLGQAFEEWQRLYARFAGPPPRPNLEFVPETESVELAPAPKPRSPIRRGGSAPTPIKAIDLTSGEIHRYDRVSDAVADGFSKSGIYAVLNGAKESYRGCAWHRDDQPEPVST
jgi:hypothetical protein